MEASSPEPSEPVAGAPAPAPSTPARRTPPVLVGALLAVAALGLLAVAALRTDSDPELADAAARPPVHRDQDGGRAFSRDAGPASAGFAWPGPDVSAPALPAAAADVCGAGPGEAGADDADAFARHFAEAGRRARERLASVLAGSADDRLRVLGLVVQRDAAVAAAALPAAIMGESCGRDAACARRAAEALADASRVAAGPKTDAIARIASASREPLAYAMAVEACAAGMGALAPACGLVSAEQWARLDADNAVPWLHVAAAAAARRDAAALADALHRVAQARRNRLLGDPVQELLNASLPVEVGAAERVQVLLQASSAIASAAALPDYAPALDFCSPAAVRDSNRAQTCDALALQLTKNAGTLLDLGVGIRLAEQIGWPQERIDELRRRHDAYSRVQVEAAAESEPRRCEDLARVVEHGVRIARLGEIGALREAVALSGKSIDRLAAEERAARPVRVAERGSRGPDSN